MNKIGEKYRLDYARRLRTAAALHVNIIYLWFNNGYWQLGKDSQGRIYVGAGGTSPQIQKLADRSDMSFEVSKCSKNFPGLCPGPCWGSLQRSPRLP